MLSFESGILLVQLMANNLVVCKSNLLSTCIVVILRSTVSSVKWRLEYRTWTNSNGNPLFGFPMVFKFPMAFLLPNFLRNVFLCQDHWHGDVPSLLVQPCYVALDSGLISRLFSMALCKKKWLPFYPKPLEISTKWWGFCSYFPKLVLEWLGLAIVAMTNHFKVP